MKQRSRTWVTGFTTAAVLAGSVGAAVAVSSVSPADRKVTAPVTAKASASTTTKSVRAWQQFRVRGVVKGMRPGTRVTLQQKQGKAWVSLPASMNTTRKSTYNLRVVLGLKGHNKLRIVAGGRPVSPVMNVWVR
ncbi:hypothetical protein ACLGI4_27570 [Streptomyces sp. HMX112]|uniref:hypothetical protein n=1 Tax=Streptomyces sp. HMX112 TaxID=3390850 RepID=UPI003A7F9178